MLRVVSRCAAPQVTFTVIPRGATAGLRQASTLAGEIPAGKKKISSISSFLVASFGVGIATGFALDLYGR